VQGYLDSVVTLKDVKKGEVALLIGLLENVFKVSDWLMIVQKQGKSDRIGHGDSGFSVWVDVVTPNCRRAIENDYLLIGNHALSYPVRLDKKVSGSRNWASISPSNWAAFSGGTGLMIVLVTVGIISMRQ